MRLHFKAGTLLGEQNDD